MKGLVHLVAIYDYERYPLTSASMVHSHASSQSSNLTTILFARLGCFQFLVTKVSRVLSNKPHWRRKLESEEKGFNNPLR